jgi:type IV pili sensor histidine kinase/response regulator
MVDTHRKRTDARCLLALSALMAHFAGCAGSSPTTKSTGIDDTPQTDDAVTAVPVVRYGRYTLVEVRPEIEQQNLLEQIVEISLPQSVDTTVGDALEIVLQHTGYQLCEPATVALPLYALPLPAVHWQLGPLTLTDALQTLAGPAWTLGVDNATRRVCFSPAPPSPAAVNHPADKTGAHARSRHPTSQDDGHRSRRRHD